MSKDKAIKGAVASSAVSAEAPKTEALKTGWDAAREAVENAANGGIFLKFQNDKDSAVVAIVGEPHVAKVVFENGMSDKPQTRISVNVVLFKNAGTKDRPNWEIDSMKIMDQGPQFYKLAVFPQIDKYGKDCAFEIVRHGAAKDPKTKYSGLLEFKLTDEQKKQISTMELLDLTQSAAEDFDPAKLEAEQAAE